MKDVGFFDRYEDVMSVLDKGGAFLTVKDQTNKINTMTIGWALLGIMWRKPILMVAVRPSRYTFSLLENAEDFTVTFPFSDMKKELVFCGTHSGKNLDKFKDGEVVAFPAKKVRSPVVRANSARFYECKIVQKTVMDKNKLDKKYDQDLYQDRSYHMYYFGEIIACYEV